VPVVTAETSLFYLLPSFKWITTVADSKNAVKAGDFELSVFTAKKLYNKITSEGKAPELS
jgi:hypothetical protein